MKTAIVTGSGGLIGSESAHHLAESGFRVIGLDNDMRASFFGETASTNPVSERLAEQFPDEFEWLRMDIRDREGIERLFEQARYLFPLMALYGGLVAVAVAGLGRRLGVAAGATLVVFAFAHDVAALMLNVGRFYA